MRHTAAVFQVTLRDEQSELMSLPQAFDLESEDEDGPLWVKKIPQNAGNGEILQSKSCLLVRLSFHWTE